MALAVSKAVPDSSREVLQAVATSVPGLKPAIEQSLASTSGKVSVSAVLDRASTTTLASGETAVRGPAVGPPYVPLTTTPANTTPGSSTDVPPGGRDYTQP